MSGQEGYGFCPRCGALMQDGVCRSCGYSMRKDSVWENPSAWQNRSEQQGPYVRETGPTGGEGPVLRPVQEQKKKGRVVAWIFIVLGIICLVVIITVTIVTIKGALDDARRDSRYGYGDGYFGYGNPYDDSWLDDYDSYDDTDEYYVPDAGDDYYVEITDATELDLSYQVIWESISFYADDPDEECTYDCICPVLKGPEGEEEKFAAMNQAIRQVVCEYEDGYETYPSGVESYGYVTYMDEEKISVVVRHTLKEKRTETPRVQAVTFRLETGEVISHEEMAQVDEELAWQFRARDSYQNGTVEFVEGLSDEELINCLKDEKDSVMFYTPVGLEIGFNYDGGWVTVTLKTDTL